jgi:hypothetical protein
MTSLLTDEQRDAIERAAAPLARDRRDAFIEQVTAALQGVPELGPGVVYRAIATAQRAHFDPPKFNDTLGAPRAGGRR